ncbi:hypothetical protein BGZ76_006700, partial [Entomortierella beljakovae]
KSQVAAMLSGALSATNLKNNQEYSTLDAKVGSTLKEACVKRAKPSPTSHHEDYSTSVKASAKRVYQGCSPLESTTTSKDTDIQKGTKKVKMDPYNEQLWSSTWQDNGDWDDPPLASSKESKKKSQESVSTQLSKIQDLPIFVKKVQI